MSTSKQPQPAERAAASERSLERMTSRQGLTSQQWEDVADLMNQCAEMCEVFYEEHDAKAKRRAAAWCMSLAMKAQTKAANT